MKYLKLFESHISEAEEVIKMCNRYNIRHWTLKSDGLVDVNGYVWLDKMNLISLPLKFGRVEGNFWCSNNKLTSLEGSPTHIEGNFDCARNNLTSLEGSPQYVGGGFSCNNNNLISLKGCPSYVDGSFSCNNNNLISLKGCGQYIGDFDCRFNNIKSFEGIGQISGYFHCENNPIFTLWRLFYDVSKIEMFNEWEIIQGNIVYLYRLNDFLETIGKEEVTNEQLERIKNYYKIV